MFSFLEYITLTTTASWPSQPLTICNRVPESLSTSKGVIISNNFEIEIEINPYLNKKKTTRHSIEEDEQDTGNLTEDFGNAISYIVDDYDILDDEELAQQPQTASS
jgi:hypothetical protein